MVSAKMLKEDEDAMLNVGDIMDAFHAQITLICLENTRDTDYIDTVGMLAQ